MHWVDVYAEKLLSRGKSHVVESGTSISGQPHLGSAGDVIIADGICKAVTEMGGEARAIWAMDDMDGLRKVPFQLPDDFKKYLGQPVFKLPCPDGCCSGFVEHFTRPFLESLGRIGVHPEAISVAGMYADGKYDEVVKTALERASEIRQILKEISGSEKAPDWLPFFPICENCGRILTTQAYDFDGEKVKYRCTGGVAGKAQIPGCGHEGEVGIRQGKLPWRIEWAARWSHLGVTCEPMGKDLTAAGGTYETSSVICERIFEHPAPLPVPYEFIVMEGQRLGKSAGRILTLGDMIDIATPEITRYFFFRSQPTTHKEIDFEMAIPKLAEDYELAERVHYGLETNVPEKEIDDISRSYVTSSANFTEDEYKIEKEYFDVPYSHLTSIVQTYPDMESITQTLQRTEHFVDLSEDNEKKLEEKIEAVRAWLDTRAPDFVKFSVQMEPPDIKITAIEREVLKLLLFRLDVLDWTAEKIHDTVHAIAVETDTKAGPMFKLMYRIFLATERGPRLGYLLASLEKDFVIARIKHFLN